MRINVQEATKSTGLDLCPEYLEKLRKEYGAIYTELYNGGAYDWADVEKGESMAKNGHPLAAVLILARRDIFSSDRECAALAIMDRRGGFWG